MDSGDAILNRTRRMSLLGDVEGVVAFVCAILALSGQVMPADRFDVPWLFVLLWSVGIGAGVGGLRFGRQIGKITGGLAAVTLCAATVLLLVIRTWPR